MRTRLLAACLGIVLSSCETQRDEPPTEEVGGDATGFVSSTQDVRTALTALPSAEVLGTHEDGVPYMIRGRLGSAGSALHGLSAQEAHARVGTALAGVVPVFRLNASDLVVRRVTQDEQGHTHIRYVQTKNGLPVVGHELVLHVDDTGLIYAANGSARDGEHLPTRARLSAEAARVAALEATPGGIHVEDTPRLVYVRSSADGRLKLAFEVIVTGEDAGSPLQDHVFVEALDGSIVERFSDIHHALNRVVYSANNGTSLPGTLKRPEGSAPTGDSVVEKAYENLGIFYNCYKTNFGRDSYNAAGAQLKIVVHYGTNLVNAFWNGNYLVCGDGDGVQSSPVCNDMDIVNHEFTHAVTDTESDLVYANESGALNEGMSDIFSAYCESWTRNWSMDEDVWKLGEDIWTPPTAGDALRYMANPTQDGSSKDYYPERYMGTSDNGGVHWNSGIANLAFKLLSTGGTHPRAKTTINVAGIGVQKAGAIFYKTNVDLMTASTTFAQAKTYTEQAAMMLYGAGSTEVAAVTKAWEAVGVGGITTPPQPCSSPVALSNGVTVTNISAAASAWSCTYTLAVPTGASNLKFDLSGGTGDGDLYVKFGAEPTFASYDCRPYAGGNTESCSFATAQTGTYYVKIYGYSTASGMSLKGAYTSGDGGNTLTNGVETAQYSGAQGTWNCWTLNVPSGLSSVLFNQLGKTGNTGDADLYVRLGSQPTASAYNCRPYLSGNTETCTISNPSAGIWYACSYGYSAYTNVTMKGSYDSIDNTAPIVSIVTPANGAIVTGTLTLSANASDNLAVTKVEYYQGTTLLGSSTTPPSYSLSWNTTTVADTNFSLTAKAYDSAGNVGSSAQVSIIVDNTAPTVSITLPTDGSIVKGTVPVVATVSDNVAIAKVEFFVDNTLIGSDTTAPYSLSWNSIPVANGSHSLLARATSNTGKAGSSSLMSIIVDNTVPTVSIVAPANGAIVAGPLTLSATASDNLAVTKVEYYQGTTLLGSSTIPPSYSLSWNTTTVADTTFSLTAKAYDSAGNVGSSAQVSITVDNTAPSVSITSPTGSPIVKGTFTVSATASDNVAITKMELFVDNTLVSSDTTAPYSFAWNSSTVADGSHSLLTRATSSTGRVGSSSPVSITVDNTAPIVSIVAPANGAIVAGPLTLSANVSDNQIVTRVEYYQGTTLLGSSTTPPSYSLSWNTTTVADTAYSLTARAYDSTGNVGTSSALSITVDNSAPTVSITAPTSGSTVKGTITLSATASDNVAITKVEFFVDNTLVGSDTTTPYSLSWDTATVANGSHSLVARATSNTGRVGSSSSVSFTVNGCSGSFTFDAANTNSATQNTVDRTVTLTAGQTFKAGTCILLGSSTTDDTVLRLFNSSGEQVTWNDDGGLAGCSGGSSYFEVSVPQSGTYTLKTGCLGNTSCSGTVAYTCE